MKAHPWPGNVRELENTVARLLALAPDERLTLALWRSLAEPRAVERAVDASAGDPGPSHPLRARVEALRAGDHRRAVRRREEEPERDGAPPRRVASGAHREAAQVRRCIDRGMSDAYDRPSRASSRARAASALGVLAAPAQASCRRRAMARRVRLAVAVDDRDDLRRSAPATRSSVDRATAITRRRRSQLPQVGGYVDPSFEAILALRPDLVDRRARARRRRDRASSSRRGASRRSSRRRSRSRRSTR